MAKVILGTGLAFLALIVAAPVGTAVPAPAMPGARAVATGAGAWRNRAVADPVAAIHKALQALYNVQDAAVVRRDARRAMASYAPEFAAVGQDGTRHTRDEEFDALERICTAGQSLSQHSRVERLITHNGQASLVLHQETVMGLFSPNTHQQITLHTEGVSQDLWIHTPQGWRLTFSKTVLQRSYTNAAAMARGIALAPRSAGAYARPVLSAGPPGFAVPGAVAGSPKVAPRMRPGTTPVRTGGSPLLAGPRHARGKFLYASRTARFGHWPRRAGRGRGVLVASRTASWHRPWHRARRNSRHSLKFFG